MSAHSRSRSSSRAHKTEYLYKILVVGDPATGKTSIVKSYVNNTSIMHTKSTIGVDFALKVLDYDDNTTIRLQLWDIAGQERFGSMTRVYYKEALGALVVYDISRPPTFESVTKWKRDLDEKVALPDVLGGGPIPVILLANKCDLVTEDKARKAESDLNKFCEVHGFCKWFYTSAKEKKNIDEAARFLASEILERQKQRHGTTTPPAKYNSVYITDEKIIRSGCC